MGRRVSRPSKKVIFGGDRGKNVPFKCGQIALEKGRNSTYDYKWHRNPLARRHPPGSPRHLPPKKNCLVPREIPLAAVVSRSKARWSLSVGRSLSRLVSLQIADEV